MLTDLHNYLYHLEPTGGLPMKTTGIVLGLALVVSHLWAWKNAAATQAFLKAFPRNYGLGVVLLGIGLIWGMMCLFNMDMGEFFFLRRWFLMLVPIGFVLVLVYVKEFLAVRSLGALMLLAAGPVLASAFLQPQATRLLLPVLAYAWILAGMFFVGMPYLMRDWIQWVTERPARWNAAVWSGVAYGALLLVLAIATY